MKKDFVFVLLQFVLFALYFIDLKLIEYEVPMWFEYVLAVTTTIGVLVILLGILNLNENLSPFPSPKKSSSLISHGIYAYVRHPIYSGIIITMISCALCWFSVFRLISSLLLIVVFYYKSNFEEKLLIERYYEYRSYQDSTGRFFPKRNNTKS